VPLSTTSTSQIQSDGTDIPYILASPTCPIFFSSSGEKGICTYPDYGIGRFSSLSDMVGDVDRVMDSYSTVRISFDNFLPGNESYDFTITTEDDPPNIYGDMLPNEVNTSPGETTLPAHKFRISSDFIDGTEEECYLTKEIIWSYEKYQSVQHPFDLANIVTLFDEDIDSHNDQWSLFLGGATWVVVNDGPQPPNIPANQSITVQGTINGTGLPPTPQNISAVSHEREWQLRKAAETHSRHFGYHKVRNIRRSDKVNVKYYLSHLPISTEGQQAESFSIDGKQIANIPTLQVMDEAMFDSLIGNPGEHEVLAYTAEMDTGQYQPHRILWIYKTIQVRPVNTFNGNTTPAGTFTYFDDFQPPQHTQYPPRPPYAGHIPAWTQNIDGNYMPSLTSAVAADLRAARVSFRILSVRCAGTTPDFSYTYVDGAVNSIEPYPTSLTSYSFVRRYLDGEVKRETIIKSDDINNHKQVEYSPNGHVFELDVLDNPSYLEGQSTRMTPSERFAQREYAFFDRTERLGAPISIIFGTKTTSLTTINDERQPGYIKHVQRDRDWDTTSTVPAEQEFYKKRRQNLSQIVSIDQGAIIAKNDSFSYSILMVDKGTYISNGMYHQKLPQFDSLTDLPGLQYVNEDFQFFEAGDLMRPETPADPINSPPPPLLESPPEKWGHDSWNTTMMYGITNATVPKQDI
jgi:hypothetical protein